MEQKKIVIIGAGVVGTSTAYFLHKMGQRNITVIEQGPLVETGGSTSHAPGLVFQLGFSKILTTLANQTVQIFNEMKNEGLPCFYPVGGLEVANSPERLEDMKRKAGIAKSWGMEASLLTPEECAEKSPLIDPSTILGGLYMPTDGIGKPLRAVAEMIKVTKGNGVEYYGNTEVTGIEIEGGQVKGVETSAGKFEADLILCCAGFWGPKIGEMAGVTIPLQPIAHQYIYSNDIPELANETEEVTTPIVRDQDNSMYFRQLHNGVGIGSYQHRVLPVEVSEIAKYGTTKEMPSVKPFTPEDFIGKPWEDAQRLIPGLKEAGWNRGMNGIFSFTPDGMPLLGESQKIRGFWVAEAIWVTQSAGVGRQMAEWIVNGAPTIDLELCDINRFETYAQNPQYYQARSREDYEKVYDIHHPFEQKETSRNMRVSPFYSCQLTLGAVFSEKAGWEQPGWYEANESLVANYENKIFNREGWAARYWSPSIDAEHLHTKEYAGLYDATAVKKRLEISGEGAVQFLQELTTSNIDIPVGSVTTTLMLHELAGIKDEIRVIRTETDTFFVLCAGAVEASWIRKHAPNGVVIQDLTAGTCGIGLTGAKATEILESLDSQIFSKNQWEIGQAKNVYIKNVSALIVCGTFAGMDSWEFFTTSDQGLPLWDLLFAAGGSNQLIAIGDRALENLRIESLSPRTGKDFWSEHDPFEVGLSHLVDLSKPSFIGKVALLERKEKGQKLVLTTLELEDPTKVIMGYEPVLDGDKAVGFVTSTAFGYTSGKTIAFALVSPEAAKQSSTLKIEYFGEQFTARILTKSAVTSY